MIFPSKTKNGEVDYHYTNTDRTETEQSQQ